MSQRQNLKSFFSKRHGKGDLPTQRKDIYKLSKTKSLKWRFRKWAKDTDIFVSERTRIANKKREREKLQSLLETHTKKYVFQAESPNLKGIWAGYFELHQEKSERWVKKHLGPFVYLAECKYTESALKWATNLQARVDGPWEGPSQKKSIQESWSDEELLWIDNSLDSLHSSEMSTTEISIDSSEDQQTNSLMQTEVAPPQPVGNQSPPNPVETKRLTRREEATRDASTNKVCKWWYFSMLSKDKDELISKGNTLEDRLRTTCESYVFQLLSRDIAGIKIHYVEGYATFKHQKGWISINEILQAECLASCSSMEEIEYRKVNPHVEWSATPEEIDAWKKQQIENKGIELFLKLVQEGRHEEFKRRYPKEIIDSFTKVMQGSKRNAPTTNLEGEPPSKKQKQVSFGTVINK